MVVSESLVDFTSLPCSGSSEAPPQVQAEAEGVCRGQRLAGGELGLVGVGREQLALDVVLPLGSVPGLQELEQLPEALVLHDGHRLQVTHDHLRYGLRDQNLSGETPPEILSINSIRKKK